MKIDSIKTRQEFYDFADVWYQRTHKLREIWQDETQTTVKREKAYLLFKVMFQRVMKLAQVAIKINQPLPRKKANEETKQAEKALIIDGVSKCDRPEWHNFSVDDWGKCKYCGGSEKI